MATATDVKQILIADPAEEVRQSLGRFLREKGLEVIEAPDGSRALAETLLRRPDVLLLDLSVEALGAELKERQGAYASFLHLNSALLCISTFS